MIIQDKMRSVSLTYNHYSKHIYNKSKKVIAEYIWIDGTGINMRSKSRTLDDPVKDLNSLPLWNYDGSSTGQAQTADSEIILKPVAYYPDPFRGGDNLIVMCSTYRWVDKGRSEMIPADTNFRHFAELIFNEAKIHDPWFGLEQEYTLFERENSFEKWPLGWPEGGYLAPQGPYYWGVGNTAWYGRKVMDLHYQACLGANLHISGVNAEVMPGQMEFQIGPWGGIEASDQLWAARYLLGRVTEDLNIFLDFHPKPIGGDWNGAGWHANLSTKETREEGGIKIINDAIECLKHAHADHIKVYGVDNELRLTGKHETWDINTFKAGVGDRGASIRIPSSTLLRQRGHFEDRRPASNMDPYVVCSMMLSTSLLKGKYRQELLSHYLEWRKTKSKH